MQTGCPALASGRPVFRRAAIRAPLTEKFQLIPMARKLMFALARRKRAPNVVPLSSVSPLLLQLNKVLGFERVGSILVIQSEPYWPGWPKKFAKVRGQIRLRPQPPSNRTYSKQFDQRIELIGAKSLCRNL